MRERTRREEHLQGSDGATEARSDPLIFSSDLAERAVAKAAAKERFVESHRAALAAIPVELKSLKARLHLGRHVAMKSHKVVDHLLFRKLFAETFSSGPYDVEAASKNYVIEPSGVRWRISEEAYLADREREGCSPCSAATISHVEEVIRPATQAFPCSTDQVQAWADRQSRTGEIYVPEWLINALSQDDADTALAVLADAGLAIYDAFAQAQDQGNFEGQRRSRAELRSLQQAIQAVETIKELLLDQTPSHQVSSLGAGVLVQIHGRDAIPVRAIPRVTDWTLPPDRLAKLLNDDTLVWPDNRDNSGRRRPPWLTAHHLLPDGKVREVAPREWGQVVVAIDGFDSRLKATEHDKADGDSKWQRDAMSYFPAGFFVWRDEFEARSLNPNTDKVFWPGEDWIPIYTPMLLGDARAMLMAGFEEPAGSNADLRIESASGSKGKPKKTRQREGDDAIQLALKELKVTASSVPNELESDVRGRLLLAAEKAPETIGFRAEKGVLQTRRGRKWSECDSHALKKRIQTQLRKMFPD